MDLYANFDRSKRPLITINFTGAKANPENFSLYLDELKRNYDPEEPFALVFDMSKAPIPGLSYQRQQAAWMKEHNHLIEQYCKGVAYVIPGAIMRGVLKSIFSIQKQPAPYTVVSSYDEGIHWAEGTLRE